MITTSAQSHEPSSSLTSLESMQKVEFGGLEYASQYSSSYFKQQQQQGIFETLCQEADIHDHINNRRGRNTRRASMSNKASHEGASLNNVKHYRRHSTFNPRNRQTHRDAHADFEEYILYQRNNQRSSIVSTLLDFHSSFEISLAASFPKGMRAALHFSCPVLSYMHDYDEDSLEMRMTKRSSLISNLKENEDFEYLNDYSESDSGISFDVSSQSERQQYVIDMSDKEDISCLQPGKRRKRHSYKVLERRLSTESHLSILKSFIAVSETDEKSKEEMQASTNDEVLCTSTSNRFENAVGTFQISSARMA
jgi:hypothetical protein